MPSPMIAVTGATGRLGGRVARRLADRGVPQRLIVRDPARAPSLPGAEVARGAYGDADATRRALAGVPVALMVSAGESPHRVAQHTTFVDAAVDADVEHLVYISFYGARPDATFTLVHDHWATEQHLRDSGRAWTFLRDNLYADFLPALVSDDGVIRGPGGDGRVGFVAQDDIADAAVAVLLDPERHVGRTYSLTGPEALALHEAARILTDVTGRPVTYQLETVEQAYRTRARYGAPDWQVEAWVTTYTAIANGEMDGVTGDILELTGHPATPLRQVLERQAASSRR